MSEKGIERKFVDHVLLSAYIQCLFCHCVCVFSEEVD